MPNKFQHFCGASRLKRICHTHTHTLARIQTSTNTNEGRRIHVYRFFVAKPSLEPPITPWLTQPLSTCPCHLTRSGQNKLKAGDMAINSVFRIPNLLFLGATVSHLNPHCISQSLRFFASLPALSMHHHQCRK